MRNIIKIKEKNKYWDNIYYLYYNVIKMREIESMGLILILY